MVSCPSKPPLPSREMTPSPSQSAVMGSEQEWPTVLKSNIAKHTTNPIRNVVDRLKIPPNPAKPLISLGLGDPTVFGNLQPPPELLAATQAALTSHRFNGYPPAIGYEASRAAVAERYSLPEAPLVADDVVITSGCSGALEMCFGVLAHAGQTILLPQPGFSLYRTLCDNKGIRVKYYRLLPEKNWEVDLAHVAELWDETTVAWLINNPSNPCGSVYSQDHLRACKLLAQKHRLTIIADEIYEDMVFSPNRFHPLASVEPRLPMLTCGGLAKRFLVPGWRLGWILLHDPTKGQARPALEQVRGGLIDLAGLLLGANSVIQGALSDIFRKVPSSFHEQVNGYIANNAQIIYDCLQSVAGLRLLRPQGAFYMMVGIAMERFDLADDVQLCERLIAEESVVCLPGVIFGMPNYIRLVYCAPPEMIQEACQRLGSFFARHLSA